MSETDPVPPPFPSPPRTMRYSYSIISSDLVSGLLGVTSDDSSGNSSHRTIGSFIYLDNGCDTANSIEILNLERVITSVLIPKRKSVRQTLEIPIGEQGHDGELPVKL